MKTRTSDHQSVFDRVDSAREFEDVPRLDKPFAHCDKLADLVDGKPAARTVRAVKEFSIPKLLPKAPTPEPAAARESLASAGSILPALAGLHDADQGGMRTTRYTISAGPQSTWGTTAGIESSAQATLAGQQAALSFGAHNQIDLNRGGFSSTIACNGSGATDVLLGQNINAAGASVNQTLTDTASGKDVFNAGLFDASGLEGASLSNTWTFANNLRVGGSIAAVFVGSAKLQPISWDDEAPAGVDRVLTKWETQRMPIIALDAGASWVHLGASVRASAYKSYQNVYEVYVTSEELGNAMIKRQSPMQTVATGLEILGLKKPPVALPTLDKMLKERDANHVQPGESVRMVRTGNMSGGVAVSAYGFRAGIYGSYTGETDLTVTRIDENQIDVTISPKHIKSVSANLDALVVGEIFATSSIATGMSRGYRIDLRAAEARSALRDLFDSGIYPGCQNYPLSPGKHTAIDAMGLVRFGVLPEGISTLYMQRAEHLESRWGAAVPKPFFLKGRVAGLGLEGKTYERSEVTSDGSASLSTRTLGRGTKRDAWRAGSKFKEISAGVRQLSLFDAEGRPETRFDGLEVKVIKGLTRVIGDARAALTQKLAKITTTAIPSPTQKGDAQTYTVTVDRLFTQDELIAVTTRTRRDRFRAAYVSGLPLSAIDTLVTRLRDLAEDHDGRSAEFGMKGAEEAQAFVLAHGQKGFTALNAMAGATADDLDISVDSSAFDKPVKKAFALQLKYGTVTDPPTLRKGVAEAVRVGREVERGLSLLRDDTVLKAFTPEEHVAKVNALDSVQIEVKQFLARLNNRLKTLTLHPQAALGGT